MTKDYQVEYDKFMESYKSQETSAEQVGEMISKLAQYFATYNQVLGGTWEALAKISKEINAETDEFSGKPIAANKAEVKTNATPEASAHYSAKIDRENIEQYINALKALQKGVMNEYSHMGGV